MHTSRSARCYLFGLCLCLCAVCAVAQPAQAEDFDAWRAQFQAQVDRKLDVPPAGRALYIKLLEQSLLQAGVVLSDAQSFVLVDRNAFVQAAFVLVHSAGGAWEWLGAAAVSTGKVGSYEHFETPLGVFAHTLDNPDFRAEGTFNQNHIRGYGFKGLRVFDFGWQLAQRGWGAGGTSQMRLQMHATDPDVLESRLGTVQSEGCIRIPSSLNAFLDRHGVLDAAYDEAVARGEKLWVLKADHASLPWPGRYMVIVDSQTLVRPDWSALARDVANRQARSADLKPVLTKQFVRSTP